MAQATKATHRTLRRDVDAMAGMRTLDPVKWHGRTRGLQRVKDFLGTDDDGVALVFLAEYYRQRYGKGAGKSRPCAVAGCSRRGEHRHHIVYRSRGGGDEPGNIVWLCLAHHLAGEHGRRLKIRGRAPDEVYVLVGNRIWKGDELVAVLQESRALPDGGRDGA